MYVINYDKNRLGIISSIFVLMGVVAVTDRMIRTFNSETKQAFMINIVRLILDLIIIGYVLLLLARIVQNRPLPLLSKKKKVNPIISKTFISYNNLVLRR